MNAPVVPTEDLPALLDGFARRISYVRISVTDRCDLRCVYCMSEQMQFLPRDQVLSLEEITRAARLFVSQGVRKIRITGGEPLLRRGVVELCQQIADLPGLDELVMTSNGTRLAQFAEPLRQAGVKRLNISLDTLSAERFKQLTRVGELADVLAGLEAAQAAGFERIKLNAVVLKGRNEQDVLPLVEFARSRRLDLSFIEEMPLGVIDEHSRRESFMSSEELRGLIGQRYPLLESLESSGGPSRYWRMADSEIRLGFISPHSHNFCASCNRVRLTAEGRLLLCLGNEHSLDLRRWLRAHPDEDGPVLAAIQAALLNKPERHHFALDDQPQLLRFMSMTGG